VPQHARLLHVQFAVTGFQCVPVPTRHSGSLIYHVEAVRSEDGAVGAVGSVGEAAGDAGEGDAAEERVVAYAGVAVLIEGGSASPELELHRGDMAKVGKQLENLLDLDLLQ
jgi:hypothetical protein